MIQEQPRYASLEEHLTSTYTLKANSMRKHFEIYTANFICDIVTISRAQIIFLHFILCVM